MHRFLNLPLGLQNLGSAVHRSIVVPVLRRRAHRAAVSALEGMCDHMLADIGLNRYDIPKAVDGMMARDFPVIRPTQRRASAPLPDVELRRAA